MLDLRMMLDQPHGLSKQAFKSVQREMLERIAALAESIYEQKRSAIIVLEGWDASGKGTTIRALTERLDARGYKVLSTQAPRTHEKQKPWLWRFWMNIPRHGQIAIFDRSWYGRVLVERVHGLTPVPEWIAAYEEINQFERTLADDGTILLKFWLHIAREEQLRRFVDLSQRAETAWQVTAEDWENHHRYDEYVAAVRDMLANTNTAVAPWAPIDATNREYRMYSICRALIERFEDALGETHSHWPAPDEIAAAEEDTDGKQRSKQSKKEQKKVAEQSPAQEPEQGRSEAAQEAKTQEQKKGKKEKKDKRKKNASNGARPPGEPGLQAEIGKIQGNGAVLANDDAEVDRA